MWRSFCAFAAAISCGLVLSSAKAATPVLFDAAADFSTTVNTETSTWSYRYKADTTLDGNYPLLPTYGPANGNWGPVNPGAWNTGSSGLPEIGVNRTGGTVSNSTTSPGDNFSLSSGTFFMRPAAGELAVLSFLYPYSDHRNILLSITFADIDAHGGDGATVYTELRHSDGSRGAYGYAGGGDGGRGSIQTGASDPGDRINIILGPGLPNGPFNDARFDTMALTVTVVPEPTSVVLLASGMLGLAVMRLRNKFRASSTN